MADLHPESVIQPQALVIQIDPATSEVMEMALRFCVQLPSGEELHEVQHWWKEATDADRAAAKAVVARAIADVVNAREITHTPIIPPPPEARDEHELAS